MKQKKIRNITLNKNTHLMSGLFFSALILLASSCNSGTSATPNQVTPPSEINTATDSANAKANTTEPRTFQSLELAKVIQSKVQHPKQATSVYEPAVNSPKSATYTKNGSKFYINSLEGYTTIVFDSKTLKKLKEIKHDFNASNQQLFKDKESTVFDYKFKQNRKEYNHFLGKPVESCLSHDGKYLWVTYYRRDWDPKAESPSAVAIIDTKTDEIVRVMPSGPLPKMIASSADHKYIAITHWGDNTVGLIDISSNNPMDFKYINHIVVDNRLAMNFSAGTNRDSDCGNCLRGTVFTPDNEKILVAKMGGNGIAVIDVASKEMLGTITGSYLNLRHIVINNDDLYLSSNKFGKVQKANLHEVLQTPFDENKTAPYKQWETASPGLGVRTIDVTNDGKYIFACVNNESKIAVIDASNMQKIDEIAVASFPVGMALSPDNNQLVVTSQGKSGSPGSGNTVTVYNVNYK